LPLDVAAAVDADVAAAAAVAVAAADVAVTRQPGVQPQLAAGSAIQTEPPHSANETKCI
jgi:hypothetical protein